MITETTLSEPTVVPQTPTRTAERVVVGVDGSEQSIDALRWAARFVDGTDARIDVLTAWEPRVGMTGPFIATAGGGTVGPEQAAQAVLSHAVDEAYGRDRPPSVTMHARRGAATDILIEESKTAQLLVIGSRGLSEIAGLFLGSVSARCAEEAQCPVLIMHAPDPAAHPAPPGVRLAHGTAGD